MALYYPVNIDLRGKKSLVVGGGDVAQRKILSLLNAHSKVFVVSPVINDKLQSLADNGEIQYIGKDFSPSYLDGVFLVISATDDKETNSFVSQEASKRNILVNIVDIPEKCNFIVPSVVEKGDLVISISTSGSSPALAKKIRKELELVYGDEYAFFLEIMRSLRPEIIDKFPDHSVRNRVFNRIVYTDGIIKSIKDGKKEAAKKMIYEVINSMKDCSDE